MRYVFRAASVLIVLGLILNLSIAQKSLKDFNDDDARKLAEDLEKDGTRESHQGPDNPMQGSHGERDGRPDPYGGETFDNFIQKAERHLNDPQWQLKIDMADPKRIVVNHPDGTSDEYWYVLFRVINDNVRDVKVTELPGIDTSEVSLDNPPSPREVRYNDPRTKEGVPVNAHLDFELHAFSRDIERNPWDGRVDKGHWDETWEGDPEDPILERDGRLEQRRRLMKSVYRPVSNHFVLQKVAEAEGMYEWMGNFSSINESVMLLHPLSDFQRQIGFAHDLSAPDLSGLRCLPYRVVYINAAEREESVRYVAVHNGDNTFAGVYAQGETLPDGVRLVDKESDEMWGKLTQRRYLPGDCVDRFGRPLRANDPGYLNARVAGGRQGADTGYGVLGANHPLVGQPVMMPHHRLYKDGDKVLFNHDTEMKHADIPNETYKINGKIVGPSDPRFDSAEEISSSTEMFGGGVVGRPVKTVDQRGRAIRRYVVTYQAGDVLSQAEWDIWQRRLGAGLLSRFKDTGTIVGRALTADDPVIGLPKIKMGRFIGDADDSEPEVIQRGIDTGRKGPNGEVILDATEYTTGRRYDPKKIGPDSFMRDPDGEYFTARIAPVPPGANLRPGEEYVYAPLGNPEGDSTPIPAFDRHDQYGSWADYYDELSGSRIPLTDAEGKLVRDSQDQILYLKEYEYEYVYMYEYEPVDQDDDGFKGAHGGDRYELVKKRIKFTRTTQPVRRLRDGNMVEEQVEIVLPLVRLKWRKETVSDPLVIDGYEHVGEDGAVSYLSAEEYKQATGIDVASPADEDEAAAVARIIKVKIVRAQPVEREVVVGVYDGNQSSLGANERGESWEEAEARAIADGSRIEEREVVTYVDRFRNDQVTKARAGDFRGSGPTDNEYDSTDEEDNGIDMSKTFKTWSRWTVPPPLVYRDGNEWRTLTRLADKIGPANRWDGADAPRFLTRYISEMWGVAIFQNVRRDWDYANVYVRGLRGQVSNAGLKLDGKVTSMPNPSDLESEEAKSFFNPRYVQEEWVYRARFERLGDEFENYRDLIRRVRTFWYRESDRDADEWNQPAED